MHHAFFYGSLMHPFILRRVIGNDGSHLTVCPAILRDYTRHQVQHADYPGIVPYADSCHKFDRELVQDERSVRGTLVRGLTDDDMHFLDIFEGTEYTTGIVQVYPLSALTPLETIASKVSPASTLVEVELPPISASTYVYANINNLKSGLWSYEDFLRDSAWKWVGGQHGRVEVAEQVEYFDEVERQREARAITVVQTVA